MTERLTIDEAQGFLDANPEVQWVDAFLFDMNGNDTSDNAEVELQFSNGITTARLDRTLPDFAVQGPIFSESNIRPYSAMEPVGVFEITDQVQVPEPTTWIMATILAAASLALSKRQGGER